jgi:hypothetical protein
MCKKQFNCPTYWKGIRVTKAVNLFCNLFFIYIHIWQQLPVRGSIKVRLHDTIPRPISRRIYPCGSGKLKDQKITQSWLSIRFWYSFFLIYFTILTIVFSSNCRIEMESTPPDFPHSTFVFTRYDFCRKEQFDGKSYRVTTPLHRVQNSSVLIDKKSYLCNFLNIY